MKAKLLSRIKAPFARFEFIARAIQKGYANLGGVRRFSVVEDFRRLRQTPEGRRRAYQVDQRLKRRGRALKQLGFGHLMLATWNIPSWMVPMVVRKTRRRKPGGMRRKLIDGQRLLWRH